MANVFIVGFAVALLLALFDEALDFITIFIPPRIINTVFSVGFSYLGLYLLDPVAVKVILVESLASAFLARTCLTIAERVATYRATFIKQS